MSLTVLAPVLVEDVGNVISTSSDGLHFVVITGKFTTASMRRIVQDVLMKNPKADVYCAPTWYNGSSEAALSMKMLPVQPPFVCKLQLKAKMSERDRPHFEKLFGGLNTQELDYFGLQAMLEELPAFLASAEASRDSLEGLFANVFWEILKATGSIHGLNPLDLEKALTEQVVHGRATGCYVKSHHQFVPSLAKLVDHLATTMPLMDMTNPPRDACIGVYAPAPDAIAGIPGTIGYMETLMLLADNLDELASWHDIASPNRDLHPLARLSEHFHYSFPGSSTASLGNAIAHKALGCLRLDDGQTELPYTADTVFKIPRAIVKFMESVFLANKGCTHDCLFTLWLIATLTKGGAPDSFEEAIDIFEKATPLTHKKIALIHDGELDDQYAMEEWISRTVDASVVFQASTMPKGGNDGRSIIRALQDPRHPLTTSLVQQGTRFYFEDAEASNQAAVLATLPPGTVW